MVLMSVQGAVFKYLMVMSVITNTLKEVLFRHHITYRCQICVVLMWTSFSRDAQYLVWISCLVQLTLKANTLELKINRVWRTNHYRYWSGWACVCVRAVSVN